MAEIIAIFGGGGMIGSHVVKKLLYLGYNVLLFDNFSSYPFNTLERFEIPEHPKLTVIKSDILDAEMVDKTIAICDRVVHLVSLTDVGLSIKEPQKNFEIDVVGTNNVLKSCAKYRIKKLVFASSASIYGSPEWVDGKPPKVSEKSLVYPTTTYASGKFYNETQMRLYYEHYGLPTTSLRYFSVYGKPQICKEGSFSWNIPIFTMQAIKGKPITVIGDGRQVRDYTHVSEIAEATVQSLFVEKTNGRAFNVGTGIPTSIKLIAEMIKKRYPSTEIVHIPRVNGDPLGCFADNSLMKELLGWVPTLKVKDKIDEYINWVEYNKENIPRWL